MAVFLSPIGNGSQFFSGGGLPLSGGFLYTYAAGSTTPAATYTTNSGLVANANPITLAADGRPPQQVWLTGGQSYKFVLTDSTGAQLVSYDNLYGIAIANPLVGTATVTSINGGQLAGMRNRIINGDFQVNQLALTSPATLVAGAYGHDMLKAGASACTYTFSTTGNQTTINITAGTLIHTIEGAAIEGGIYALSNQGTATARIGVNNTASAGAYAACTSATPLLSASAIGGQNIIIEFGVGTLDRIQLELGTVATMFERWTPAFQMAQCQRYVEVFQPSEIDYIGNNFQAAQHNNLVIPMKATKRLATPSVSGSWTQFNCGAPTLNIATANNIVLDTVNTAAGQWRLTSLSQLIISARL